MLVGAGLLPACLEGVEEVVNSRSIGEKRVRLRYSDILIWKSEVLFFVDSIY